MDHLQSVYLRQRELLLAHQTALAAERTAAKKTPTPTVPTQQAAKARIAKLEGTLALITSTLHALAQDVSPGEQHSTLQALITFEGAQRVLQDETASTSQHEH